MRSTVWRLVAILCLAMCGALSSRLAAQGLPDDSRLTPAGGVSHLSAAAATAFTVNLASVNPGADVERSACVSVAIRANLAVECGDLRLSYALPAKRVWSQSRAPVMLYNSQFARPTPIVRVAVTPTGVWPGAPVSVTATLRVQKSPGAPFVVADSSPRIWTGAALTDTLGAGLPSQLALSFDATALPSGLYPISVEITMDFGGGNVQTEPPVYSEVAIVNRKGSEFGTGWWVAGYERLQRLPDGNLFWIGGDGSTRRYTRQYKNAAGVTIYAARALAGRDSLSEWPDATFRRHLTRGAYVHFTTGGRHDQTVSSVGAITRFDSQLCSFLTDIVVNPLGALASAEAARWRFWYAGYDADDPCATYDPANPTGWYDRVNTITTDVNRSIARYWYPDSGSFVRQATLSLVEGVSYTERNGRIVTYRDALGTETRIGWGANGTVTADSIAVSPLDPDPTKRYIVQGFRAGEAAALSKPIRLDSVYTRLSGPRTDVAQETKLFIGAFGQPTRAVNALGQATDLTYSAAFPLLPTMVPSPNGLARNATYDANVKQLTPSAEPQSYDDSPPVTTYTYDPAHPDNVTSVTDASGVYTRYAYGTVFGTYPVLDTIVTGSDERTTVTLSYSTAANSYGLPRATTSAQNGQGLRATDTNEYDALGNLSATQSAGGKRVEYVNDAIGRVVLTRTRLAVTPSVRWMVDSTSYDALDRVTRTDRFAGDAVSGPQSVTVNTRYLGVTGLPVAVARVGSDGIMGTLTDSTEYDAIGRVTRRFAQGVTLPESLTYDPAGNVTRRVTPRGGRITSTFDALNRPATVMTSAMTYESLLIGTATQTAIDASLRPAFPRVDLGRTSRLVVDGDTASFTYDAGTGQIASANNRAARISRSYFANGALQSETQQVRSVIGDDFSQHAYTTSYTYDAAGRRKSVRHPTQLAPGSGTESWSYDALTGRPTLLRDPMDSTVQFFFDPLGQLSRQISPSNVSRQYTYTLDGEVATDLLAPGNATIGPPSTPLDPLPRNFQYDGYIRYVNYAYDARGKLLMMRNTMGLRDSMAFDYSPMGHLRRSYYKSRFYDYAGRAPSTDTLMMSETIRPDAMGTSTWRQTATQNYNFAGAYFEGGRYNASNIGLPTYIPNTGRLARTILCDPTSCGTVAKDTLRYDASGNTIVQQHQDFMTTGIGATQGEATDRVMYYNAADQLVAVDARIGSAPGWENYLHFLLTFDEYRYDALGRRVFARSQRMCAPAPNGVQPGADFFVQCNLGYVQRTVWDGSKELYEIRMPDQPQHWEKDGLALGDTLGLVYNNALSKIVDRDAYYGRVGYLYGGAIDKPIVVLRQDYGDRHYTEFWNPLPYRRFQPFALYPQWDLRGEASLGTSADGGISRCEVVGTAPRCTYGMAWTQVFAPTGKPIDPLFKGWTGSLLQDKREPNGLLYRRNRYLDPGASRFTQPDPIGIAGGLNAYGYAAGDPISFSDPFGLCPDPTGEKVTTGDLISARINCWLNSTEAKLAGAVANITNLVIPIRDVFRAKDGVDPLSGERLSSVQRGISGASALASVVPVGRIAGYTKHGINQAISRDGVGVAASAILDAVSNPTRTVLQSGGRTRFVGENATVVLSETGKVITAWARNAAGWRLFP